MHLSISAKTISQAGLTALFSASIAGLVYADTIVARDQYSAEIGDRNSSFLAVDLASGDSCVLEGSDLETRHAPWSTFKIPNTILALQTGAVAGTQEWRDWNPAVRPAAGFWPDASRQGQTLETAFQRSVVWYYRDIAVDIGAESYRKTLKDWSYGNARVRDGSDTFWLGQTLTLSVQEQVGFLERLVTGQLNIEEQYLDDLHDVSLLKEFDQMTLHGKSGSGPLVRGDFSGVFEGWFAGWLLREGAAPVVFAHYAVGPSFSAIRFYRQDFAELLLEACGYSLELSYGFLQHESEREHHTPSQLPNLREQ